MSELYQHINYVAIIFSTSYFILERRRLMYNRELTWGVVYGIAARYATGAPVLH